MNRNVSSVEDVLRLMDALFEEDADRWTSKGARWWDGFYDDRERPVPFFREAPDESLVSWHATPRQVGRFGQRQVKVASAPPGRV